MIFALSVRSQADFTIGSATGTTPTTGYPCPIQDYFEGSRTQFLYLASELQAAGIGAGFINSIKFNALSITAATGSNFPAVEQLTIGIGTTTTSSLDNVIWETTTTTVFGPVDYNIIVGDNEFLFSTPFLWNGTDNIVIDVCNGDPANGGYTSWTNNATFPMTTGLSFNGSHTYRVDNAGNKCGQADIADNGLGVQTSRPDIIFNWTSPTACSGTPVGGNATSSKDSVCVNQPFNLFATGASSATGLTYQWQSSTDGTNYTDIAGATGFSYKPVGGISVSTYFKRKLTCTSSSGTGISTPVFVFVRPFYECYCGYNTNVTLHTASTTVTIDQVDITGGTLNYTNSHPGSNAAPTLGYAGFTDSTGINNPPIPVLKQAGSYTLTLTSGAVTPSGAGLWIDWNHNGLYDSAEYQFIRFNAGTTSATLDLEIPANAPLGLTMMRLRVRNTTFIYNNACTTFGNGETEDYIFRVAPGTACSGAPLGGDATSNLTEVCSLNAFSVSVANASSGLTGLTYQWQDSSSAHTWQDIAGATSKNYSSAGITTATCFRRKTICNNTSTSFSTVACVTMKQIMDCYCGPNTGITLQGGSSPWIQNINFNDNVSYSWDFVVAGGVNIDNTTTGTTLAYSLYNDTNIMATLSQAIPYTFTATLSANLSNMAVWIDFDHSGTFEVSERQDLTISTTTGAATINIPANAQLGVTIMRVRARNAAIPDACFQDLSGETEDYVVKIVPGTSCTGTPNAGATAASTATACNGIPVNLTVTGSSAGVLGLTYQWQDSTVGGIWQDVSGQTNLAYSTTQSIAKYYRRKITCNNITSAFSTPVFVDQLLVTYATVPFTEDFENNWEDGCGDVGTRTIPNNSWRNSPLKGDSSWRRNDDAAAANWVNPTLGVYTPGSSLGTYSARFHSYQATNGTSGNLDLYVNFSTGSPIKRLSFDYINTSGSDSVQIFVSNNAGTTFTKIGSFATAAAWTNKVIDFTATGATSVLRFKATSDFGTTDIGLDNLSIITIAATDIAANTLLAPTGSFTLTNSGIIALSLQNVGGAAINFATDSMKLGARISRPSGIDTVYYKTIKTGTLAIGASRNDTITTSANFTAIGTYSIRAGVGITADPNVLNDSIASSTFTTTSIVFYAIANGNWGNGSTWSTGTIPTPTDTVNITGYNVSLGGAVASPYTCNSLGIGSGGSLTVGGSNVLNIGTANGSNKALTLSGGGATLNIAGGTLNQNGFLQIGDSTNFNMSSGNLNIDGNSGTDIGSVPSSTDLLGFGTAAKPYSFGNINITGGTITIVDPHRFNGTAIAYRGSIVTNLTSGCTMVLGNPTSTHTSVTGAGGFIVNTLLGSARMSLGNLTLNGGNSVGNRFASFGVNTGINGTLTINANAELRTTLTGYYAGNIVNNGIMAVSTSPNFQTYLAGTAGPVTTAQTVSGTGIYRNNAPTTTNIATGTGYSVGDILTLNGGISTTPATIYVSAVGGTGSIVSSVLLGMGNYTVAPTGAQSVSGGTGTGATFTIANSVSLSKFAGITFNNTSAAGITFNSLGTSLPSQTGTILGTGTLTMIAGIINTPNDVFTLGTSPTQRGSLNYTSGVFTGKLRRWFTTATNTGATGDFPVGKGTFAKPARVEFTTAPTKGGTLTAEFLATAPGLGGFPINDGITLENVAEGYWRVDADSIVGGNYTISITDSGITNAQTVPTLRIVKRASNTTNWGINGIAGTNSGTITKPVVVRTGLSGFSEFTIAGASDNILPYTSLKFIGERVGNMNQLKWIVVNEIDVKSYELQRSANGVSFTAITTILSKANDGAVAPKLEYSFTDNNSITNDGYYRLKQVAKDGSVNYSNIVLIKGLRVNGIVIGNIYPNPAKDLLNLVIASPSSKNVTIAITSISGKQVLRSVRSINDGDNLIQLKLGSLAAGNYTINVFDTNGNKSNIINFIKE